jgi:hypothetical protein
VSEKVDVWVKVMEDMDLRRRKGLAEYGVPVTPGKSLEDLLYWLRHRYAELLDDAVYTKAAILTVEESLRRASGGT